jgi:hypothetical protein
MIVKLWRAVYVVGSDGVVLQVGLIEGDFSGVCAYRERIVAIGQRDVSRGRGAPGEMLRLGWPAPLAAVD